MAATFKLTQYPCLRRQEGYVIVHARRRMNGRGVAKILSSPPDEGRFSLASVGLDNWRIEAVEQFADVGELFRLAPRHDLLLYVHGYNQTFETAVLDVVRLSDGISRIFTGRTAWAKAHTRWLCEQTFDHPAQHVVLAEYGRAIEDAESRLERLTGP